MYALRKWSVRHSRGLEWFYRCFEKVVIALHPLWRTLGYARIERPVALVEKNRQGIVIRLPDVRALRAQFHGYVVPDELPQAAAQRALRRRARRRQLRGQAGNAVRLGRSLEGQPQHAPRRQDTNPASAAGLVHGRRLGVAAGSAPRAGIGGTAGVSYEP